MENVNTAQAVQPTNATVAGQDKLDTGMQVLIFLGNFCITPLLGLILYLVWKDTKPMSAKKVCTLTLISFGLQVVLGICYVIFTLLIVGASNAK